MGSLEGMYDQDAAPDNSREVMPQHECVMQIKEAELKDTKAGNGGKLLALTWELLDGPHKGRRVWQNLNVKNPNPTAQAIGNAEFAAVRIALFGSKDHVVKDTSELIGIPCRGTVAVNKAKDGNEIKKPIGMGVKSGTTTPASSAAPWSKPATGERF